MGTKTLQKPRKSIAEKSEARDRLFAAAKDLMLAKGFAATTVDQICEAAQVTKGCFFHYFESKNQLGRELLGKVCCESGEHLQSFFGESKDPLERVYRYVDGIIQMTKGPEAAKGCLLGTFAQELSEESREIRTACAKGFSDWARQFGGELAKAKAKYAPKAAFDPKELATHLIAILEGSLILAKANKDMTVIEQNLLHFKRYLKKLFEP